ncbi:DUF4199 domain-containing protein [Marivirga arenosa]|jgi:hypothetical protein|uniref:DUF4199 domain-containing protein n=1 Tax=Marivirga arenosa TaxID=3059076 RepID=A0AA51ZVM4_9BACT|nr:MULTISPECIES: DUF4199 domain-containing protein [unclassified Marivirga]WKK85650.1 DUF4199 domain-containing protein [Marivirga sp. ABR2-2]WNB17580.1 DUF4199 domain-containing protein [Marivirga sp. BKB1-2]
MKKDSIEYNGIVGGIGVLLGLIALFIIMKLTGLEHNLELRALNIFIMGAGVLYSIKSIKKHNSEFNYFKGIGTGMLTAAISSIAFATFIFIYLMGNPDFLMEIKNVEPFGNYLNAFTISFIIILEGAGSGFFLSFGVMQWYKKRHSDDFLKSQQENRKTN